MYTHTNKHTAPALHLPILHSFLRSGKINDQYSSILSLANIVRHHHIQHNGARIWYKLTKIRGMSLLYSVLYTITATLMHTLLIIHRGHVVVLRKVSWHWRINLQTTDKFLKRCEHYGKPHSPGQTPPLWVGAGHEVDILLLLAAGHGDLMRY